MCKTTIITALFLLLPTHLFAQHDAIEPLLNKTEWTILGEKVEGKMTALRYRTFHLDTHGNRLYVAESRFALEAHSNTLVLAKDELVPRSDYIPYDDLPPETTVIIHRFTGMPNAPRIIRWINAKSRNHAGMGGVSRQKIHIPLIQLQVGDKTKLFFVKDVALTRREINILREKLAAALSRIDPGARRVKERAERKARGERTKQSNREPLARTSQTKTYHFNVYKWISKSKRQHFTDSVQARSKKKQSTQ